MSVIKANTSWQHAITNMSRLSVGTNIMCVCPLPENHYKGFKGLIRAKNVRARRLQTKEHEQLALLLWGPHTTPTLRQLVEAMVAAMNPSDQDLQVALDQVLEASDWPRCGVHVFKSVQSLPLIEDLLQFNLVGLNSHVCKKLPGHNDFLCNSIEATKVA